MSGLARKHVAAAAGATLAVALLAFIAYVLMPSAFMQHPTQA